MINRLHQFLPWAKRISRRGIGPALALLASSLPLAAAESAGPGPNGKPIDVLMISANEDRGQIGAAGIGQKGWPKFKAACAAEGVSVNILGEGNDTDDELTSDLFKKFQVIVVAGSPHNYNEDQSVIARGEALVKRLDAYHKAGGGLIFVPFGHDNDPISWTESFGKLYDAEALREKIYDPPRMLHVNPLYQSNRCDYFWTGNIAPHPVTEGVHGLLLPRQGDYDFSGTVPMKFGKEWTTLIRGANTLRTIGYSPLVSEPEGAYRSDIPGTYTSAPEIVGVREFDGGAGRMMVFPFHPAHTWANFHSWVLNDAMMLNGYEGNPSDGMKLFLKACRWLAEPAQKAGLGGYVEPPAITRAQVTPIDWSKAQFPADSWSGMESYFNARTQTDVQMTDVLTPGARDFKGILGAKTSYGDGTGTVAEYVAAAKKLGLSFVVFLDDVSKMNADRYARLVADCKAASSPDFAAVPGYLFRDTINAEYYVIDPSQFPRPDQLTADGRVKSPNDVMLPGNNYANGGLAGLEHLEMDPYFLLSYFTLAPYVYDDGKLVDNGFSKYLSLQARLHHMPPVSLTIVHSPAQLADTVAHAHIVVYHAQDLSKLPTRLGHEKIWTPNPEYITNGPEITRWGVLNAIGQPFAPGRQRVRFALEARSDVGIDDVRILDALTGKIFRHFKPGGAHQFACTIDEMHKNQWYLIPIITDPNGRTALGPTIETFQDGGRISGYMDNVDAGYSVIGWDDSHQMLKQWQGWMAPAFHHGSYPIGDMPVNPFADELVYDGVDGSSIGCGHCQVTPQAVMGDVTEPKQGAFYYEHWLASFDNAVGKYGGHDQFMSDLVQKLPGCNWGSCVTVQVPMKYVDIESRIEAVRPRYHAPLAANINQVNVTFKKDCTLSQINLLHTFNRVQKGPMYVTGKDQNGEWSALDDGASDRYTRRGVLGMGDYIFLGSDYSGAPAVINLSQTPLTYNYSDASMAVYIDGGNRPVKAGDKIVARFMIVNKPRGGQNNCDWIKKFIAEYAIGGGTPGYQYTLTQGKLLGVNYTMNLRAENGGATVAVQKYDLPHNLLVKVAGMPTNAIAGRYDLAKKQLLILPVYENTATTSINTTLEDTRLYVGELFHCSDPEMILSCVQDGADKFLLEVHNPTADSKNVSLNAAPGFTPLAGFTKSVSVTPYSSVKMEIPAPAGTLIDAAYQGD